MKKQKYWSDIQVIEHNEFGRIFIFTCPDCGDEIKEVEAMTSLNNFRCSCGKTWQIYLYAESVEE